MIVYGFQIRPMPGKGAELAEKNAACRKIIEAHGGKPIGSFRVTLGADDGSLIYMIGHESQAKAEAVGEAIEKDPAWQKIMAETDPLTLSVSSWLLSPLPDSAIQ
jgi:hypothetical protein